MVERLEGPRDEEDEDQPELDERDEEDERELDERKLDDECELDERELEDREPDDRELEERDDGGIESPFLFSPTIICIFAEKVKKFLSAEADSCRAQILFFEPVRKTTIPKRLVIYCIADDSCRGRLKNDVI